MTQMRIQPEQSCSYQDIFNPNDSWEDWEKNWSDKILCREDYGASPASLQPHEGSCERTHQHAKTLQKDHNPSSFYVEIHLNSPRKKKLVVLLVVAEAEHLKDIRIHIHF